jgi:hypothetical protein
MAYMKSIIGDPKIALELIEKGKEIEESIDSTNSDQYVSQFG